MNFVVLGGAGAMGRITVTDLVKTLAQPHQIIIADYDLAKAQALAKSFNSPRVTALQVNVNDLADATKKLKNSFVLINAVQYQMNLAIMKIALACGCHYIDLGGLFHVTRQQLELDKEFKKINKTALIGMGAAPGITNLLAALACEQLNTVREIHTRVASVDHSKYQPQPALAVSYSLKTILEEFSFEPAVFRKGKFEFVAAMSGDTEHVFPKPIGKKRPMYTIHSEVATLPLSYAFKGVQEVSFKIAFDQEFTDKVRFLRDLGLASHQPIKIGAGSNIQQVIPIDVINYIAMNQPPCKVVGKLKQYEVVRAVVKGTKNRKKVTLIADCHTQGMPEWGVGLDIDTGTPPAVAAQMLLDQEITRTGVVPAEVAVDPKSFFNRLKKRKMKVVLTQKSGWNFKV